MTDVVVIGGGNAGLAAAIAVREVGASVLLLERGPERWRGGNSFFTAGAFRFAFAGAEDVLKLVPKPAGVEVDLGSYPEATFAEDSTRITLGRSDPELNRQLVSRSYADMRWLKDHGVSFVLSFDRQAFLMAATIASSVGLVVKVEGHGCVADRHTLREAAEPWR